MKNYIKINIVNPLTTALQTGKIATDWVIASMNYCFRSEDMDAINELGDAMLPFYRNYFYADPSILGHDKWEVREVIKYCMKNDDTFYYWLSDGYNILQTAHSWAEHHKKQCQSHNANAFLQLLESMTHTFYGYECSVNSDEIRQELIRERKEGNAFSREIYCIMHAFIAIWHEEHNTFYQKIRLFNLLSRHWNFPDNERYNGLFRIFSYTALNPSLFSAHRRRLV